MVDLARWRRPGANEILLVLLLLATTGFLLSWVSPCSSPRVYPLSSFSVMGFVLWRVSRVGGISRALLMIGSCTSLAVSALAIARVWDVSVVALVTILSLIHISEPTRLGMISYAVFCLKKKKKQK